MFPVLCIVYTVYVCVLVSGVTERSLFSSTRTLHSPHTHTHTHTHTHKHEHTHEHHSSVIPLALCTSAILCSYLNLYPVFISLFFHLLFICSTVFHRPLQLWKIKHIGIDYKIILGHHWLFHFLTNILTHRPTQDSCISLSLSLLLYPLLHVIHNAMLFEKDWSLFVQIIATIHFSQCFWLIVTCNTLDKRSSHQLFFFSVMSWNLQLYCTYLVQMLD